MREVPVVARPATFADLLDPDDLSGFTATMDLARRQLAGHTVWHVNSTAEGGGVAEMLHRTARLRRTGAVCARLSTPVPATIPARPSTTPRSPS